MAGELQKLIANPNTLHVNATNPMCIANKKKQEGNNCKMLEKKLLELIISTNEFQSNATLQN